MIIGIAIGHYIRTLSLIPIAFLLCSIYNVHLVKTECFQIIQEKTNYIFLTLSSTASTNKYKIERTTGR